MYNYSIIGSLFEFEFKLKFGFSLSINLNWAFSTISYRAYATFESEFLY